MLHFKLFWTFYGHICTFISASVTKAIRNVEKLEHLQHLWSSLHWTLNRMSVEEEHGMHAVNVSLVNSRSVSEHSHWVDAVGVESAALKEGTVVTQIHALTRVVTALEQLHAVLLAVLKDNRPQNHDMSPRDASRVILTCLLHWSPW